MLACAVLALAGCATHYLDIAEVRERPAGSQVALRGVVTVPFGAIGEYIAVQDATGGIVIVRPGWNPEFPAGTAAVGSRIEVAGRLLVRDGQLAVEPAWYRHRGSAVPAVRLLRTGEVGPANEGTLVAVAGRLRSARRWTTPRGAGSSSSTTAPASCSCSWRRAPASASRL